MRIDQSSLDFLMKVLSDLYSDPQEAVIREYSVNARDSHKEAGVTRPIEITTPTQLSPYFKVQDFGVGLSLDDLRNIYSAYGASTKRDTNEQTGMLGLGSKSGLTITGQFTVVAVKNGIKAHVTVGRTETGGAVMEIVDTATTTDPNGVLISIPVGHNSYGFEAKVANFFQYWEPGSVLVNGTQPSPLVSEDIAPGIRIVDNKIRSTTWSGTEYEDKPDVVVMGGIAYPIDSDYTPGVRTQFRVIFDVPIGSVNFTPSREQLHYTKQTKQTIDECYARYNAAMATKVSDALLAAESIKEALEVAKKWADRLGHLDIPKGWQYQGHDIPAKIGPYESINFNSGSTTYANNRYDAYDMHGIKNGRNYYTPQPLLIVTDFPMEEVTSYARGRINRFRESNSGQVVLTKDGELAKDRWTEGLKKVTWKELLAATRKETAKAATTFKTEDEFHILEESGTYAGSFNFEIMTVPAGKTVYYFEPKDYPKISENAVGSLAKELDAIVVKVYARRVEDFNKLHTSAKPLGTMLSDLQALYESKVSDADKFHNTAYRQGLDIAWLPKDRLDDPELVKLVELAGTPRESKRWFNQIQRNLSDAQLGHIRDDKNVSFDISCLARYPLLNSFSSGRARSNSLYMDDVCDYLNNTYTKRK